MRLFSAVAAVLLQQLSQAQTLSPTEPGPTNVAPVDDITEPAPVSPDSVKPSGKCANECPALRVISNKTDPVEFNKCCSDNIKTVQATGKIVGEAVCPKPNYLPCMVDSPEMTGCFKNFQLYFMMDLRTEEKPEECTTEYCNSRFIKNTEMIKNWIYRVVYTIKKYKKKDASKDFLVVVQYPQSSESNMLVSYADEVLKAEKEFGDKIMDMAMKGQKARTSDQLKNDNSEIIKALECLTSYANAVNSDSPDIDSITCMKFQEEDMKTKRPEKDSKKILFTFTHGPVTVSSDRKSKTILNNAEKAFDRMDVVTIGYRKSFEKPLFQSPNGITYEYDDYTDLLRDKEVNNLVSAICEGFEGSASFPVSDPCLLDLIFAVDSNFCDCSSGLRDACCGQANRIIAQMKKFVNQVVDKLRKNGGYTLGKEFNTQAQSLRVGMYSYYKNGNDLKADVVMDLTEWSAIEPTTSLDKFREAIHNGYKNSKSSGQSNVDKVYLRNVLKDEFSFKKGNKNIGEETFLKKFVSADFADGAHETHSQVFVIFSEDDSSEGPSEISHSLELREATLAFKDKGIDVIAMPIKTSSDSDSKGLEYDAGLVNSQLDTPPNSAQWTALNEVKQYEEERADKLVSAIYRLDECPQKQPSRKCQDLDYNCTATLEFSWSGCLMGPSGINGKKGTDGAKGGKGPIGLEGLPSHIGEPGTNGEPGPPGYIGNPGVIGKPGDIGQPGPTGPPGTFGPKGPKGLDAKINIFSWNEVHNMVKDNCGCKTCEKTISDEDNVCESEDGTKCLKKQPVWWLGQHIDRQYFIDSIEEFLGDEFAQQAVNHLTMHNLPFTRDSWDFYIKQVGVYLLGEEDYKLIEDSM